MFSFLDCSLIILNENKDHIICIDEYDPTFLLEQSKKPKKLRKKKNEEEKFIDISLDNYFHRC